MLLLSLLLQSAPPLPPAGDSGPVPATDPASWITADDYPAEALRENKEGQVRLAIAVDKAGRPIGCIVEASSGSQALDGAGCTALMARASFRPALNAEGKAIAGVWKRSINWQIPHGVDGKTVPVSLREAPGGVVCEVIVSGTTRRLAEYLCGSLKDAIARSGRPLTGVVPVQLPDRPDIYALDVVPGLERFPSPPK